MRALFVLAALVPAAAQPPAVPLRYQIDADLDGYPQASAKQALASVIKALERKRYDYLLAHLADPEFVDERVRAYGGRFDEVVRESAAKYADNPETARELARFLKDGEWEETATQATAKLKDMPTRQVILRKIGDRWFLENRQRPPAKPEK
jgi:hypothetical protein